ncbi:MAG: hypothetical protein RI993_2 [Pseudomonadota bacterium]
MSYFRKLSVLLCIFLFCISLAQADFTETTRFSEPGRMCFPQTSLRAEPNKFNNIMLDHHLIISEEDHFKEGLVFVGFRLKSQPDTLWLFDGENWMKHSDADSLRPFFLPGGHTTPPEGQLQPVMPTFVSNYPIDVSEYIGDGELWVGYGLSSETRTSQESFDEMINSERFNLVWEIGNPKVATAGDLGLPNTICLSITELTRIIHTITTQ